MKDPAREVKQAFKRWNVWYRIVTRGDDDIVKCFSWKNFISDKVFDNHSEVISLLIVDNIFDSSAEVYILFNLFLTPSAFQVVEQNFSWGKGRYWFSKMILECVVWKLKAFFWTI